MLIPARPPNAANVTTKTPTDVAPNGQVNLTLRSDSFSSTTEIKNYLLCPDNSNFSNCNTSVNGLSIDKSGHISGHAPSDSAGKDLTEWVVAKNQYGYSKLSDNAPKVEVDTYSTLVPNVVINPSGDWIPWPNQADVAHYTITITPSKVLRFTLNKGIHPDLFKRKS
ncbi:MAG: hypothetical protein GY821_14640 [Gammaproteobacteria bacterium]|nr:hypothetical protein [Gammaproteobacteria bacterium]